MKHIHTLESKRVASAAQTFAVVIAVALVVVAATPLLAVQVDVAVNTVGPARLRRMKLPPASGKSLVPPSEIAQLCIDYTDEHGLDPSAPEDPRSRRPGGMHEVRVATNAHLFGWQKRSKDLKPQFKDDWRPLRSLLVDRAHVLIQERRITEQMESRLGNRQFRFLRSDGNGRGHRDDDHIPERVSLNHQTNQWYGPQGNKDPTKCSYLLSVLLALKVAQVRPVAEVVEEPAPLQPQPSFEDLLKEQSPAVATLLPAPSAAADGMKLVLPGSNIPVFVTSLAQLREVHEWMLGDNVAKKLQVETLKAKLDAPTLIRAAAKMGKLPFEGHEWINKALGLRLKSEDVVMQALMKKFSALKPQVFAVFTDPKSPFSVEPKELEQRTADGRIRYQLVEGKPVKKPAKSGDLPVIDPKKPAEEA